MHRRRAADGRAGRKHSQRRIGRRDASNFSMPTAAKAAVIALTECLAAGGTVGVRERRVARVHADALGKEASDSES